MRKRTFLFFSLLVCGLCASCKGGGLAITSVEPRMIYEFSEEGEAEQFLFVFVKAEDCDSGEAFLALSLDQDVDKGDIVKIEGSEKKARVVYADLLYYDQLPFYEAKLPTCRKLRKRCGQA